MHRRMPSRKYGRTHGASARSLVYRFSMHCPASNHINGLLLILSSRYLYASSVQCEALLFRYRIKEELPTIRSELEAWWGDGWRAQVATSTVWWCQFVRTASSEKSPVQGSIMGGAELVALSNLKIIIHISAPPSDRLWSPGARECSRRRRRQPQGSPRPLRVSTGHAGSHRTTDSPRGQ
jgi:hypothetical protein